MSLFRDISKYCLVTNCHEQASSSLIRIPWTKVFDFDVDSLTKGLFSARESTAPRRFRLTTWHDRPKEIQNEETEWFFPRGYQERPETCCRNDDADHWERKTANDLKRHCEMWAEQCLGSFRTVVLVLWYDTRTSINFAKLLCLRFLYLLPRVKIVVCFDSLNPEEANVVNSLKTLFPKRLEIYDNMSFGTVCNFFDQSASFKSC